MNFITLLVLFIVLTLIVNRKKSPAPAQDTKTHKVRLKKNSSSVSKAQHQRHIRDDDPLLKMILGEQEFNQEQFDNAVANLEMEVELAKKKEEEITNQMRNKYKGL